MDHNQNNEDTLPYVQSNHEAGMLNFTNIPAMIHQLNNDVYYEKLLEVLDEDDDRDYTRLTDMEIIYLFVQEKKDTDETKNRTVETKKEYLREILQFYVRFREYLSLQEADSLSNELKSLNKLNNRHIRQYEKWLIEAPLGKGGKPYSVTTLARKKVVLKSFLSYLYRHGYIEKPVHQAFMSTNVHKRDLPNRDLSSEEVMQLLEYYKGHPILYSLFSVLITTGLRVFELCNSRVCDVTYEDGVYWLKVTGKGNKDREVLLFPNVFDTIVEFRKRRRLETELSQNDTSPLFVTANNKPYSSKYLSNYLTKAINKTNLPFVVNRDTRLSPHALRHAFAIISAENGADVYKIMRSLGHEKIETTMIYLEKHFARKNHAGHSWGDSKILKSIGEVSKDNDE